MRRLAACAVASTLLAACGSPPPDPRTTPFERLCKPEDAKNPRAGVRFAATFENGRIFPPYDGYLNQQGPGIEATKTVVRSPARSGSGAMRLVMPPSAGQPNRSQLQTPPELTFRSGEDWWYGISIYLGDDWDLTSAQLGNSSALFASLFSFRWRDISTTAHGPSGGITLDQLHGTAHFVSRRDTRGWQFPDGAGTDTIDLGPAVTGRWVDFVMHIKWSDSEDGALRELWRDGRFMGRSTRQNMGTDSPIINRVGVYEGTGIDHGRTLYWDEHRIGRSCADVDPTGQLR